MADLKTNYVDDVLDASVNTKRKYNMIQNADGTVSFDDVTTYTQNGDSFGAKDVNDTNTAVNELNNNLTANDGLVFQLANDEDGNYGMLDKEGNFMSFSNAVITPVLFRLNGYYGGDIPVIESYTVTTKGKCLVLVGTHSANDNESGTVTIKLNNTDKYTYTGSSYNNQNETIKAMLLDVNVGDIISIIASSTTGSRGGNVGAIIFIG